MAQIISIPFVESEILLLYKRMYKFQVNGLMPTATKHQQYLETILLHLAEITPLKRDSEANLIMIQGSCDAEQLCQIELILEELAEQLDEGDYIVTVEPSDLYNGN